MIQLAMLISYIQCESKKSPYGFLTFFFKWYGIFRPNFRHLLYVYIHTGLQIFIQLSAILISPYVQNVHHRLKRTVAFSDIFQNSWEFLVQILHTYYLFLYTVKYKFLFNYLQL